MKYQNFDKISELKIGDIIRHKGGGNPLVICDHLGSEAIAVRTTHVSNPIEWEVLKEK